MCLYAYASLHARFKALGCFKSRCPQLNFPKRQCKISIISFLLLVSFLLTEFFFLFLHVPFILVSSILKFLKTFPFILCRKQRGRDKEKYSICWFTPWMPTPARFEPGWCQELTPSGSLNWVRTQGLKYHLQSCRMHSSRRLKLKHRTWGSNWACQCRMWASKSDLTPLCQSGESPSLIFLLRIKYSEIKLDPY